jgi:glutathione S-transferase
VHGGRPRNRPGRPHRAAALGRPREVNRDRSIVERNPLGKVPTLITDEGDALYDSRVICEYLDARAGARLFPAAGTGAAGGAC